MLGEAPGSRGTELRATGEFGGSAIVGLSQRTKGLAHSFSTRLLGTSEPLGTLVRGVTGLPLLAFSRDSAVHGARHLANSPLCTAIFMGGTSGWNADSHIFVVTEFRIAAFIAHLLACKPTIMPRIAQSSAFPFNTGGSRSAVILVGAFSTLWNHPLPFTRGSA